MKKRRNEEQAAKDRECIKKRGAIVIKIPKKQDLSKIKASFR